jgi:hypothetical protein
MREETEKRKLCFSHVSLLQDLLLRHDHRVPVLAPGQLGQGAPVEADVVQTAQKDATWPGVKGLEAPCMPWPVSLHTALGYEEDFW